MHTHFARNLGQNFVPIVQLNFEHCVGQCINDFTVYLNFVFLGHFRALSFRLLPDLISRLSEFLPLLQSLQQCARNERLVYRRGFSPSNRLPAF